MMEELLKQMLGERRSSFFRKFRWGYLLCYNGVMSKLLGFVLAIILVVGTGLIKLYLSQDTSI